MAHLLISPLMTNHTKMSESVNARLAHKAATMLKRKLAAVTTPPLHQMQEQATGRPQKLPDSW
jgi:hypothetical protein